MSAKKLQPRRAVAAAVLLLAGWGSGAAWAEVAEPSTALFTSPAQRVASDSDWWQRLTNDPLGVYPAWDRQSLRSLDCSDANGVQPIVAGAPLALAQVLRLALCRNPQMTAATAQVKAQAAALGSAGAAYWPTLNAAIGQHSDQINYPDADYLNTGAVDVSTASVSLNWRLLDFGGRAAGRQAARAELDAAVASLEATALKTQSDVTSAYFDAQSAKASLAAQKDLQDLAQQTLHTLGRMQARGAAAQGQTMQAAAELAKIRLSMSRVKAALAKSLTELATQMALAQEAAPVLQDANLDAALALTPDLVQQMQVPLAQLYAQAQEQHPDIVAARAQLLAAQERLGASASEGRPTLDLAVNYYENGRPNQSLSSNKTQETLAGLTISIPLFDGFASTYKVRRAEADLERAQAILVDAQQRVYSGVDKAQSQARNAWESTQFATEWEKAATELAATTRRKLEQGAADLSEYLRSRSSVVEAQQERWRSMAEWQSAVQQLLSSTAAVKGVVYRKP